MSGDKTSLLPLPKDMRDFNMATPSLGHLFSFLHVTGVKKEKIPKSNRIYEKDSWGLPQYLTFCSFLVREIAFF